MPKDLIAIQVRWLAKFPNFPILSCTYGARCMH